MSSKVIINSNYLVLMPGSEYSHVAKTGDIKGFVITEESGIAKGIRRIIAVTGHEAADVSRQAKTLAATLNQIEKATGKEKDAMLKTFSVVCTNFVIFSLIRCFSSLLVADSLSFFFRNLDRLIFRS